jgi:transcriptional regulator with XRE-family HTH domain
MTSAINTRHTIRAGHPGERILLLRGRLGLTQDELHTLAGVNIDTIRRTEQGYTSPTYATLQKLATALQTTVSYLTTPID